jgi:Domain of unknown function (DUF4184)
VPFTLSHPAAAIPFARSRLVLSALIVGSLAPDFQYFVKLSGQERNAHAFPGIVQWTFPVAILLLAIFHMLLKWPLISLLPLALQYRLVGPASRFRWWPLHRFLLVMFSLAFGIITHVVWDSFTHVDGWFASTWPGMRVPLFYVRNTGIPAFKLAQHLSTLLGGVFIIIWIWKWYRRTAAEDVLLPPRPSPSVKLIVVFTCLLVASSFGVSRGLQKSEHATGLPYLQLFVSGVAVSSITLLSLEMLTFSAVWWIFASRRGWKWLTCAKLSWFSSQ